MDENIKNLKEATEKVEVGVIMALLRIQLEAMDIAIMQHHPEMYDTYVTEFNKLLGKDEDLKGFKDLLSAGQKISDLLNLLTSPKYEA